MNHNQYTFDLLGHDFCGLNLYSRCFGHVNLAGADFRQADLQYTVFDYANLQGADFSGTNLRSASLSFADLRGAKLEGAKIFCHQLWLSHLNQYKTRPSSWRVFPEICSDFSRIFQTRFDHSGLEVVLGVDLTPGAVIRPLLHLYKSDMNFGLAPVVIMKMRLTGQNWE